MPQPNNPMSVKRIHKELADIAKEDLGQMTLGLYNDSLFHWRATIPGPAGSPYEGGSFEVDIQLAQDYPFTAPKAMFLTRIYHMNISERGAICIDILKSQWSPALSLFKVVLSLSSLLTDPNPKDPLVPSIAQEYVRNRTRHDSTAREWTALYAVPKPPAPKSSQIPVSTPTASTSRPTQRRNPTTRRQQVAPTELIVIEDDDETAASSASHRNARKRTAAEQSGNNDGASPNGRRSKRIRGAPRDGDVIVIDD